MLPAVSVAEMVTVMLPSARPGEIGRAAAGDAGQDDGVPPPLEVKVMVAVASGSRPATV